MTAKIQRRGRSLRSRNTAESRAWRDLAECYRPRVGLGGGETFMLCDWLRCMSGGAAVVAFQRRHAGGLRVAMCHRIQRHLGSGGPAYGWNHITSREQVNGRVLACLWMSLEASEEPAND